MLASPTLRLVCALAVVVSAIGCSDGDGAVGDVCAATGKNGCTSDHTASFICVNGVYRERPCFQGQMCANAQCQDVVCRAGLFFCDGTVADSCDATGTQHTRTDCAAEGQDCVVGALDATCVPHTCAPATTYCAPDGSEVRKCASDGSHFDVVQACDDPEQRGNTCAGAACYDRCTLAEAQDRSTLGCRFITASLSSLPTIYIANVQPDLPARVVVSGRSSVTRIIAPGAVDSFSYTSTGATGSSLGARAISLVSTVPVQVWLDDGARQLSVHPEHALGARHLVAVEAVPEAQTIEVVASVDQTTVTVEAAAPISAGNGVPGGNSFSVTLARGQVLTASSSGALTGSRVDASAPVAVIASSAASALAVPPADALGLDFITVGATLVVARDDGTVLTTELDGTLTLSAGASTPLKGPQRVRASAPVLAVGDGSSWLAPVDQWLDAGWTPAGGSATIVAEQAQPVTLTTGPVVQLNSAGSYATATTSLSLPAGLTAPAAFLTLVRPQKGVWSSGYALRSLHP